MTHRRTIALTFLFGLALVLAGCFGSSEAQSGDEVIRTPRPTFTPTPKQPTATPVPVTPTAPAAGTAGDAASAGQPLEIAADAPIAVVNSDQVNARKLPSITSDNIIRELARGDELRIIGQSADDEWWFVCCMDNGTAWVYYSYVDTSGDVDAVPVTDSAAGPVDVATVQAAQPAPGSRPLGRPLPATPVAEEPAAAVPAATEVPRLRPRWHSLRRPQTPAPTEPPPAFPLQLVRRSSCRK